MPRHNDDDIPPTHAELRQRIEHEMRVAERERVERRLQVWGLVFLAVMIAAFSVWRAGVDNVFTRGWWRL